MPIQIKNKPSERDIRIKKFIKFINILITISEQNNAQGVIIQCSCRNVRSDLMPSFISKNQLTPSVYCQIYDVLIHTQTPDTYKNESFKRPISRSFINIKFLYQLISPLIINELKTQNEESQLLKNLLSNQFSPIETHIQTAFTGIFQDIQFNKSSNIVEYYF